MLRCFGKQDKWEGLDLFLGNVRVDDLVDLYLIRPCLAEATNIIGGHSLTRSRRVIMPTYEFFCEKCNRKFTLTMKICEYDIRGFGVQSAKALKSNSVFPPFKR